VLACDDLAESYKSALEILNYFQVPPNFPVQSSITAMKERYGWSHLAVALAILFQDINCEWFLFEQWQEFFTSKEWNAETDEFSGRDDDSGRTLAMRAERIIRQLRSGGEDTIDGIVEFLCNAENSSKDPSAFGHAGARRCVELLDEAGIVNRDLHTQCYRLVEKNFVSRNFVPPCPKRLPGGFLRHSSLGLAFSIDGSALNDPSRRLRIVFGLDDRLTPGDAPQSTPALGRLISYAFGLPSASAGTAFLDRFRGGHGPRWLKAVCRDFARELGWTAEGAWPPSIG
jgi:hypothetical protein